MQVNGELFYLATNRAEIFMVQSWSSRVKNKKVRPEKFHQGHLQIRAKPQGNRVFVALTSDPTP